MREGEADGVVGVLQLFQCVSVGGSASEIDFRCCGRRLAPSASLSDLRRHWLSRQGVSCGGNTEAKRKTTWPALLIRLPRTSPHVSSSLAAAAVGSSVRAPGTPMVLGHDDVARDDGLEKHCRREIREQPSPLPRQTRRDCRDHPWRRDMRWGFCARLCRGDGDWVGERAASRIALRPTAATRSLQAALGPAERDSGADESVFPLRQHVLGLRATSHGSPVQRKEGWRVLRAAAERDHAWERATSGGLFYSDSSWKMHRV